LISIKLLFILSQTETSQTSKAIFKISQTDSNVLSLFSINKLLAINLV